ncbi:hypothetical protein [uncultured Chryseobacterium sp.]|uniref:hypothetical protein n=1 Tax=uncultured Chryseobacterium sp. TaxID=259322 RepID=UPI0025F526E3|nr:hypothetical protein [uncultured Chryseobacterium sp.]
MKIEVRTNELDTKADHKLHIINEMSILLYDYFLNTNYGDDIKEFRFLCIIVRTKPGYEDWYKARKPKYVENKTLENFITKETIKINNQLTIEFKIDYKEYDDFIDSTDEESKRILAKKILESLEDLDKLPKKVKDFDKERFKEDMEHFFKEQNLL